VKHNILSIQSCLAALLCAAIVPGLVGAAEKKQAHPELSDQEQYIACAQCHEEATPELHSQWYSSNHGLAMVKCYQCHGTFETFRVTPTRQDCATCHENMMEKCPQDKPCWQCHIPHTFEIKKE
jgi:hypothetical protein